MKAFYKIMADPKVSSQEVRKGKFGKFYILHFAKLVIFLVYLAKSYVYTEGVLDPQTLDYQTDSQAFFR
jgi:hypothetical protein